MKQPPLDLKKEQKYWQAGCNIVVGLDEVGRGALAGPVVAAGIVFSKKHQPISEVIDSKQLSAKKRTLLAAALKKACTVFGIGEASAQEIDQYGISTATTLAMDRALSQVSKPDFLLIDGTRSLFSTAHPTLESWPPSPTEFLVKGDQHCYSIAAASIVAKVYRDQLMHKRAEKHPEYGWQTNVGYGTAAHRQALRSQGPTRHHRHSFLSKILS